VTRCPDERFVSVTPDLLDLIDGFADRIGKTTGEKCSRARATRMLLRAALSATESLEFDVSKAVARLEGDLVEDVVKHLRALEALLGRAMA